jgi:putative transposase
MNSQVPQIYGEVRNQSSADNIVVPQFENANYFNKLENKKVFLTIKEVRNLLNITERAIRKNCKNGKYRHYIGKSQNKKGGNTYYIALSSLPVEAQIKYYEKNYSHLPSSDPVPVNAVTPPTAHGNGGFLNVSEKLKNIALAKLDLIRLWREFRSNSPKLSQADQAFVSAYNSKKIAERIYEVLGPVSIKSLYRWVDQLDGTDDWTRLIPQWKAGKNGGLSEEEKNIFLKFLLDPKKVSIGSAIRLTKFYLSQKNIESKSHPITFRRFANRYIQEHKDVYVLMRDGQKALKDKMQPYITRNPELLNVGDVLVADGHRLNFQVVNPFTGKPCRAVIVAYIDWKSMYLCGYEIMLEENTQCIASALRNAIITLGKIPKLTYQDNGKAFRARFFTDDVSFDESGLYGLFARLGIVPVFAMPYNARAKVIERWFQEFTNTFERLMPSFTGSSIDDKPAYLLRNEKFHKAMRKEYVPTIEEVNQFIGVWLEFQHSQPCPHVKGKTIREVFEEGKGSGIDVSLLDDLMMSQKKTKIYRNGIRFLNGEYYDEALYGLSEEVVIKYSLFDVSYVKVYRTNGEFLCCAKRQYPVHPMAEYLGDVKDVAELKERIKLQRRLEKKTLNEVKALNVDLDNVIPVEWQRVPQVSHGILKPKKEERVEPENVVRMIPESRPFFRENYERYEWHLKFGTMTEEDRKWVEWYMTTDEFKLLYLIAGKEEKKEINDEEGL